MKKKILSVLVCALLLIEVRSENPSDTLKLDVSLLESLQLSENDNNKILLNVAQQLNEWYPSALIGLLDPEMESFEEIDKLVLHSHYSALHGELFWLGRLRFKTNVDNDFLKCHSSRRVSSVVGSYPVSYCRDFRETLHFASLVARYWNINEKAVVDAITFNLPRWNKEDALLPILMLSIYEVEGFEEKLESYEKEEYSRTMEIVRALIKAVQKSEKHIQYIRELNIRELNGDE